MKIAITGHSRGLGKSLTDVFQKHGHEVLGFSLTNGYNISIDESREDIIKQATACDIFINNAYHPTCQTDLLKVMIDAWKDTDNLIINVASKLLFVPVGKSPYVPPEYITAKKQQYEIMQSRIGIAQPRLLNFIPGPIETEMSRFIDCPKLNTQDLAELIYMLVSLKDKLSITEIVVDVPGLNGKDIKAKLI